MSSADLDVTVKTAVKARTINNGESCIAAKRFIVAGSVYQEFERRFVEGMAALKVGDPMDDATDIGSLATEKLVQDLDAQVQRLISDGARVLSGAKRIDGPGNYYMPTVLTNIDPNRATYREELFGPVAMLFRVRDITEAIRMRTKHHLDWRQAPGRKMLANRRSSSMKSRLEWCSLTRWSHPIRDCRSVASSVPVMAANSVATASENSRTSRPFA